MGSGHPSLENGPHIWRERVNQAAASAKIRGKLPSHIAELVEDMLQPRLNWREILRDYIQSTVKTDYRLMPPNKRYLYYPIYLPSLGGEHLELAVAIDTSGSISNEEAARFLAEVRGIAQQFDSYAIHLFQCDAAIQGYWHLSQDDQPDPPVEVRGRGGTDFVPVFEEIDRRGIKSQITCLVYFTDGYGRFPDTQPPYHTLWGMTTEVQSPFGTIIQIRD